MAKSKKEINADHYKKKKEAGWFSFIKRMHKDNIKPISKQEIEAFCQAKARKDLIQSTKELDSVKGDKK